MTKNQLAIDDVVRAWLVEHLKPECEAFERSNRALEQMYAQDISVMDIFEALRNATSIRRNYEGGCFVVEGVDLDNRLIGVVIAPPSDKSRIRVVKVWTV